MSMSGQIGQRLHQERTDLEALFAAHRQPDGTLDMPAEKVAEARKRNDAITDLAKQYDAAVDMEQSADSNAAAIADADKPHAPRVSLDEIDQPTWGQLGPQAKTLGQRFTESPQYALSHGENRLSAGQQGPQFIIDLEQEYGRGVAARGVSAALFDTSGFAIQSVRIPTVITPGEQQPTVASLMPQGRTTMPSIAYMEETTTTTGAAETAESGSKPEAALAFTERTSTVRKIAVSLPVTDESLDDIPMIETYIDNRLRQFVLYREDAQLLAGNGTPPNLRGILNTSGILTQAKGADPTPDAVYKAMTQIRVNAYLEPTGAVFHPNDWQDVRLLRTTDGVYIWGNPSEAGPERIWGLDVVQTTAETQNTALIGSFRDGAQIFRRSDLALQVGWVNDQFVKNQRTILLEERLALVVFRPKAFCTVTGI